MHHRDKLNNSKEKPSLKDQSAFTLFEVILSIGILLSLSVASTNMIRGAIDMKGALAQRAGITHRLSVVMQKVVNDLQHVFIISTLKTEFNYGGRTTKALFRITPDGDNHKLAMTTMSHRPMIIRLQIQPLSKTQHPARISLVTHPSW